MAISVWYQIIIITNISNYKGTLLDRQMHIHRAGGNTISKVALGMLNKKKVKYPQNKQAT